MESQLKLPGKKLELRGRMLEGSMLTDEELSPMSPKLNINCSLPLRGFKSHLAADLREDKGLDVFKRHLFRGGELREESTLSWSKDAIFYCTDWQLTLYI